MTRLKDWRTYAIAGTLILFFSVAQSTVAQNKTDQLARDAKAVATTRARDSLIADYASCLRGNAFRSAIRKFAGHEIELVFKVQAPAPPRTPEVQRIIDKLIVDVKAQASKDVPPVDCRTKTPLPPKLTRPERDRLSAAH